MIDNGDTIMPTLMLEDTIPFERRSARAGQRGVEKDRWLATAALCSFVATGVLLGTKGTSQAQSVVVTKDVKGGAVLLNNQQDITLPTGATVPAGTSSLLGGESLGQDWFFFGKPTEGGAVTITNSGRLLSNGSQVGGLSALSRGGDGAIVATDNGAVALSSGASSGAVNILNSGAISTTGAFAAGVSGMSVGGTGNDGVKSVWDLSSISKSGGPVSIIMQPDAARTIPSVSTSGEGAAGIVALSAGGGDLAEYQKRTGRLQAVSGGNAGTVRIDLGPAVISTRGAQSTGVLAQSIGGASGISLEGKAGQHGGNGASITVTGDTAGSITTRGLHADAMLLQSFGGSGGNGSSDSGSVAVGGDGGRGGSAGAVTVNFRGMLQTYADHALGLMVQSIGGGGGRGGNATAEGLFSAVAIGGSGGNGGQGGPLDLTFGNISTAGSFSHGVNAQSIGGGGGHGGSATARATSPVFSSSVAIGGSGGEGGDAGTITLSPTGNVYTSGTHSFGLFASSIGGGGGTGGSAATVSAAAGPVSLTSAVSIGGKGGKGGKGGRIVINQPAGTAVATSGAFSSAIVAHSIGGGGGTGGDARSISVGASNGAGTISVSVAAGGSGGEGNGGGEVVVNTDGVVSTLGSFANGIEALSVGGGGGSGGSATAISGAVSAGIAVPISVSVGGSGGKGGNSSSASVVVERTSSVITAGDHATGVLSQSIGGGGGNAGSAVSLSAAISEGRSISLSAAIGGSGGSGGSSGYAGVTVAGRVTTSGAFANAVLVQSIGGGGGKGGSSLSIAAGASTSGSTPLSTSVGGTGGTGGNAAGALVSMSPSAFLATTGDHSTGVLVQSIGGGGGSGGNALSGTLSIGEVNKPSASVAIGGSGGSGGQGNLVRADLGGFILTQGVLSHGILAQSIGGGGGFGGNSVSAAFSAAASEKASKNIALSIGGTGGAGGTGGPVTVTNSGNLQTIGTGSNGIIAQSVGGSGGYGGNALSVTASVRPASEGTGKVSDGRTVTLSMGGNGGNGGNGGTVHVFNAGSIQTTGQTGTGIFAQSVAGGGGAAGHATSIYLSAEKKTSFTSENGQLTTKDLSKLILSAGGVRGGFGIGGDVLVEMNRGFVRTEGDGAIGILAQSISGGGGTSALSDPIHHVSSVLFGAEGSSPYNHAGQATVVNLGEISTKGIFSSAIVAQSIGGGGGAHLSVQNRRSELLGANALASETGSVHLGGLNGNGSGNPVTIASSGSLSTTGDFALGILGQSIGGGGGLVTLDNDASTTLVDFGGSWDRVNRSDAVTITNGGQITTRGKGAIAVLAQSVGGGGGLVQADSPVIYAETPITIIANKEDRDRYNQIFDPSNPFRRAERLLNFGGDINVTLTSGSDIRTYGNGAAAIYAQTIAGPGGLVQMSDGSLLSKTYNRGDRAGNVSINMNGRVETHGNQAPGIHAAMLDGDYSWRSEQSHRRMSIEVLGSLDTFGTASHGIVAELSGNTSRPEKQTSVDITVARGARIAVSGQGSDAIHISNATPSHIAATTINNAGTVGSKSGFAIVSDQKTSVINSGTLTGSIKATGPVWAFKGDLRGISLVNTASGSLLPGSTIDLGIDSLAVLGLPDYGHLQNFGLLSPGGRGAIQVTTLQGAYVGAQGSTLEVDLDMRGGTSDRLEASSSVQLNGAVRPQLTSFGRTRQFTIVKAPFPFDMAMNAAALDTPVVDYSLSLHRYGFQGWDADVTVNSVNFAAPGLSDHDAVAASWLNDRLSDGDTDADMVTLANAETLADYQNLLDSYASEHATQQVAGLRASASGFQSGMLSCGQIGPGMTAIDEGECTWGKASSRWLEYDGGYSGDGRDDRSRLLSFGSQYVVDDHWRLGFAAGYETLTSQARLANSETQAAHVGAIAKYQQGNALFAIGLSYGHGWTDSSRSIPLSTGLTARASHDTDWLQARFRAAYLLPAGSFYLKRSVDLDVNYIRSGGYTETGAPGYNLTIAAYDDVMVSVTPSIEIGTDLTVSEHLQMRPFAFAGVQHSADTTVSSNVKFSPTSHQYSRQFDTDKWVATFGAGISLFSDDRVSLDLRYDGTYGENVLSHAVAAKLRVDF
jgi:hypothetical protein